MKRAFTLLELLVVMAIMGMMATASISAYRSMRLGMEEGAVVRNASQFVRLAYQRSKIDRVPVNVYFWNETRHLEDNDGNKLSVAGRAVAVRRLGRITSKESNKLVDEFGDLDVYGATDDEGELDPANTSAYQNDSSMYLYRVNGDEQTFQRSLVSRTCAPFESQNIRLMSDPDWKSDSENGSTITSYAYWLQDANGIDWKKGDAYGVEIGDFELPDRYLFGNSYSQSIDSPNREIKVMNFNSLGSSDGGGQTIQISAIRPNAQGEPEVKTLDSTVAPNRKQEQQN